MLIKSPFLLWNSCLLILSGLALFFIFPVAGHIDLYLIQPWVDSAGHFASKGDWYLATLSHTYVKKILILVYIIFLVLWCASFKVEKLKARRWQYGYMFWVSMLCTCAIGFLKAHSAHACPWNMTHATTTGFVWDFSATAGHCFPGGHASTGFALLTGYFTYRLQDRKRAWFYLFAGLTLGFAMGWAQMMRGAHFLSHNLWTGWICLTINFVLYAVTEKYHVSLPDRNSVPQAQLDVVK